MNKLSFEIPVQLKQLISSEQAFHYRIIPVEIDVQNDGITFLTDASDLKRLQKELLVILGKTVSILSESTQVIDTYLAQNYRKANTKVKGKLDFEDNFLHQLITTANEFESSDIHLEPYENFCRVRLRLDGKLKEHFIIENSQYPQIANQIKIQAGLDISQKRLAQDGRISFKTTAEDFDIRVSTMPTLHGEKIVLRLLKRDSQNINLDDLGFTKEELVIYREAIRNTQGIILISGPTGSGKTTTLYGTLKELNKEVSNILTIEDPIEYTLEGINQVQLREDIQFDFPAALRAFLRQDPDVIMVGEIRDDKTAAMAVKASLTGHLVLSTIHTNSAWATVSRLIDMNIPTYLLSSTLTLSMAQRLVRKLCSKCKKIQQTVKEDFPLLYQIPENLTQHYRAEGCNYCFQTGYLGRIAIYELLPITKELEEAIRSNKTHINDYMIQNNVKSLKENALRLVVEGITSVEEVYNLLSNE